MNLVLSGGGIGDKSRTVKKYFLSLLDSSKPLLYLPLAADVKKRPYSKYFNWIKEDFSNFSEIELVMKTEEEISSMIVEDYSKFSGVFIGGGNTFKLLKLLKESNAFEILKKLGEEDFPIYGESAGAVILSQSILPALFTNDEKHGLSDFDSFGFFKGYFIFPHYEEEQDKDIKEFMEKNNLDKVLAIPEVSGLFVTKERIEVIGNSPITFFEKNKEKKKISLGEKIPTKNL